MKDLTLVNSILSSLPGLICAKNREHIIIYANDTIAQLCGYSDGEKFIGLTDYDILADARKHAEKFIEQDELVMKSGPINSIDFVRYADEKMHIVLSQKTPLVDSVNPPFLTQFKMGGFTPYVCNLPY